MLVSFLPLSILICSIRSFYDMIHALWKGYSKDCFYIVGASTVDWEPVFDYSDFGGAY